MKHKADAISSSHFEYLNHKMVEDRKCVCREPYLINSYPETLNKKVVLLLKFKKFMNENLVRYLTISISMNIYIKTKSI